MLGENLLTLENLTDSFRFRRGKYVVKIAEKGQIAFS